MTSILQSRAAQRKQRLLEIEKEQRIEEAEALKLTEEQRQMLLLPFMSVKVEFSDLDGMLSWRQKQKQKQRNLDDERFVVLTNADLALFSPTETIRASFASKPKPSRPYFSFSSYSSPSSPTHSPRPPNNPSLHHRPNSNP